MNHVRLLSPDHVEQGAPTPPIPPLDDGVDCEPWHRPRLRGRENVNLITQVVQGKANLPGIVTYPTLHRRKLARDEQDPHRFPRNPDLSTWRYACTRSARIGLLCPASHLRPSRAVW